MDVKMPDGTVVKNVPEGTTRAQLEAKLAGRGVAPQNATPQKPPISPGMDMLGSVPGALAKGVAAVAGFPGDAQSLVSHGADYVFDKATGFKGERPPITTNTPTSGAINKAISDPFGGYYKSQTKAGEYTDTILSFAPAALSPGSILARLLRAGVPGAASETAGQRTKGTPWEPYARAGGALIGGMGVGAVGGALARRSSPTIADIGKAKDAAYKAADNAGVVIKPESFNSFAMKLGNDITKNNVVQADVHKGALSALNIVQQESAMGVPLTLARADKIRQAVNGAIGAAAKNNDDDLRIAMKVKSGLDDYLDGLTSGDTLAGSASLAVPILKEARSLAAREYRAKEIQEIIDLAENATGANWSASGSGQALRQGFKNLNAKLIKNPHLAKSFTAAERAAIVKAKDGAPLEWTLRMVGKLAPTNAISQGVGPALGAAAGAALAGPVGAGVGAVAVPAVGAAARMGSNAMTNLNARDALATVLRGPTPTPVGASQSPLIAALLSQAGR